MAFLLCHVISPRLAVQMRTRKKQIYSIPPQRGILVNQSSMHITDSQLSLLLSWHQNQSPFKILQSSLLVGMAVSTSFIQKLHWGPGNTCNFIRIKNKIRTQFLFPFYFTFYFLFLPEEHGSVHQKSWIQSYPIVIFFFWPGYKRWSVCNCWIFISKTRIAH